MPTPDIFTYVPNSSTTANQVNLLGQDLDVAFSILETLLTSDDTYNSSINSSIGSLDTKYLKDYYPDGGSISYTQNLFFPLHSKEASLELYPLADTSSLNNITINNLIVPATVYTYKHDGVLILDTDFSIIGRKIIFKTRPTEQLTITYLGYSVIDGQLTQPNLRRNVYPHSSSVSVVSNTYTLSGDYFSKCSDQLKSRINNSENIDGYVSVFLDDEKILLSDVEITTTSLKFHTESTLSDSNSFTVYLANTTLGDLIEGLYRLIYSHNHSTTEGEGISHRGLLGLYTNTDTIKYSTSDKENYEHPQYFNREGYIADPTVYNNAVLGDILVSSTDSSNYFNNLEENSNKIVFGSYTNGHTLYFDKNLQAVVLDSSEDKNGLNIKAALNKTILRLNNNYITNKKLLDNSVHLEVMLEQTNSTGQGIIKFVKRVVDAVDSSIITATDDARLYVKYINTSNIEVNSKINLESNSKLTFGTPELYEVSVSSVDSSLTFTSSTTENTNYKVKFTIPTKHVKVEADLIESPLISLNGTSKISFGTDYTQSIDYVNNYLTVTTPKATNYRSNGYRSGLTFDKKYWMYCSTSSGESVSESTVGNQDLYVESGVNGSVYFINNTDNGFTTGVDDLTLKERADLYSKSMTLSKIVVNYNASTVSPVCLDPFDNNKIFAGKDLSGNISTILKTNGKVIIANNYTPSSVGTPVIVYGELLAGRLACSGDINSDSGYYGNVFIPSTNKLVVTGTSLFDGPISFTNKVTMTSDLTADTILVKDLLSDVLEVKEDLITKTLEVTAGTRLQTVEIKDSLEVSKAIIQNSSTANNVLNGTLKVVGKTYLLQDLDLNNSVITGVINSAVPAVDEAVSYALLKYEQSILEESLLTAIDTKVDAAINSILSLAWPLGSVYMNETSIQNPSASNMMNFGVWNRSYEGRSPMGVIENTYILSTITDEDVKAGLQQSIGSLFGEYVVSLIGENNGPHTHQGTAFGSTSAEYKGGRGGYWNHDSLDHPGSPTTGLSGEGVPHLNVHPVKLTSIWTRMG
jgi:hypothetical protein